MRVYNINLLTYTTSTDHSPVSTIFTGSQSGLYLRFCCSLKSMMDVETHNWWEYINNVYFRNGITWPWCYSRISMYLRISLRQIIHRYQQASLGLKPSSTSLSAVISNIWLMQIKTANDNTLIIFTFEMVLLYRDVILLYQCTYIYHFDRSSTGIKKFYWVSI